jgi:hypothetical protein
VFYCHSEGKIKKREESGRATGQMTQSHGRGDRPKTQSHGPAPEASISCKRCKTWSTAGKTSQADFRSSGMFWMGSMPRSTRMPEILMTYCDSHSALLAHLLLALSAHAQALSSSVDRSRPSGGCRPCSRSFGSIASCTSRSVSYS